MQPCNVSLSQQAHPVRIAAKGLGARVCRLEEVAGVDYIQGRSQVQVESQGGQFPPQSLTNLQGVFLRPGGANRHRIRQLGEVLQELILLSGVILLGYANEKWDVSREVLISRLRTIGVNRRLAFLPG